MFYHFYRHCFDGSAVFHKILNQNNNTNKLSYLHISFKKEFPRLLQHFYHLSLNLELFSDSVTLSLALLLSYKPKRKFDFDYPEKYYILVN